MKKEKFNELKLKFTDGNGRYIHPAPFEKMASNDLREYIDYIHEKWVKAEYWLERIGGFKQIAAAGAALKNYESLLKFVKKNRLDVILSEDEKNIACFG